MSQSVVAGDMRADANNMKVALETSGGKVHSRATVQCWGGTLMKDTHAACLADCTQALSHVVYAPISAPQRLVARAPVTCFVLQLLAAAIDFSTADAVATTVLHRAQLPFGSAFDQCSRLLAYDDDHMRTAG
jgi:hypothetical protein